MLDYLEKKLPPHLYYHNIKHTIDVTTEVELIGWAEGVSEEDVLLLKLAALFHDAGHTISYKDHEYHGSVMAREKLASYDFTQEQIDTVCRLIMATNMPPGLPTSWNALCAIRTWIIWDAATLFRFRTTCIVS